MELTLISDTHTEHKRLNLEGNPEGILVHSGDACGYGTEAEFRDFCAWFGKQNYKYKVYCPGNHDRSLERNPGSHTQIALDNGIVLGLEREIKLEGVNFYLFPWQLEFCNWAFNITEEQMAKKLSRVPPNIDVFVTHGPPYGILDTNEDGMPCGSRSLLEFLQNRKDIKVCSFGHIHESYGSMENVPGIEAKIFNASMAGGRKFGWVRLDSSHRPWIVNV